jgi:hypothetical protein
MGQTMMAVVLATRTGLMGRVVSKEVKAQLISGLLTAAFSAKRFRQPYVAVLQIQSTADFTDAGQSTNFTSYQNIKSAPNRTFAGSCQMYADACHWALGAQKRG